jgi:Transmembrane proteins 14C
MLFYAVCSIGLTYVMGQRYLETSKIMPAGVVAGLRFALLLSVFLSPSLLTAVKTIYYIIHVGKLAQNTELSFLLLDIQLEPQTDPVQVL